MPGVQVVAVVLTVIAVVAVLAVLAASGQFGAGAPTPSFPDVARWDIADAAGDADAATTVYTQTNSDGSTTTRQEGAASKFWAAGVTKVVTITSGNRQSNWFENDAGDQFLCVNYEVDSSDPPADGDVNPETLNGGGVSFSGAGGNADPDWTYTDNGDGTHAFASNNGEVDVTITTDDAGTVTGITGGLATASITALEDAGSLFAECDQANDNPFDDDTEAGRMLNEGARGLRGEARRLAWYSGILNAIIRAAVGGGCAQAYIDGGGIRYGNCCGPSLDCTASSTAADNLDQCCHSHDTYGGATEYGSLFTISRCQADANLDSCSRSNSGVNPSVATCIQRIFTDSGSGKVNGLLPCTYWGWDWNWSGWWYGFQKRSSWQTDW